MDKPRWAHQLAYYRHLEQAVQRGILRAAALRCSAWVDGDRESRCTADAQPEHTHRYRIEDLP